MTEIILGVLLLAHIAYHAWYVRETQKEREKMQKAIMAKNLQEYHASEIMDSVTQPVPEELSEHIPMEEADDKAFQKAIENELNG